MKKPAFRTEKDSLGEKQIPNEAYYGIQALRAKENFPISRNMSHPCFIYSIAKIKAAAATVNGKLGLLPTDIVDAINQTVAEILEGKFDRDFIVDVYQAGAGTSLNMNLNEVIANRANELLGIPKEQRENRRVHPNDHVNMSQSTNDVIPCAIRIAVLTMMPEFKKVFARLIKDFDAKAKEFDTIIKSGRTHLQDAVPIRLGQEFGGYAATLRAYMPRLELATQNMGKIGIGGSAAGTGLNVHPKYRKMMVDEFKKTLKLPVTQSDNYFASMQSQDDSFFLSSVMAGIATELSRIANDLRLLNSGPRTGLAEILLPPVQPGSSIMPGKVNPVMAEMLNMVCFQVLGFNNAIQWACGAGQLELNVMMPLIANDIIEIMQIMTNAIRAFDEKCVRGITAYIDNCKWFAENSISMVTVLNTYIGYDKASEVAKEAVKTGKGLREIILERKLMDEKTLEKVFYLAPLTEPGIPGKAKA